jgi:hypothetical protein
MEARDGITTAYLVKPKRFFIIGQSVAPCFLPATSTYIPHPEYDGATLGTRTTSRLGKA